MECTIIISPTIQESGKKIGNKKSRTAFHILAVVSLIFYFTVSCLSITDYGPIIDSQKNYHEGRVNLDFILTGTVDQDDLYWQMHGAFSFMLADLCRRIFSERLGVLDPVAARHMINPILMVFFLYFLFLFVRDKWGEVWGLVSMACLITYPALFGHSFNNLKDIPLLIFFSLAILSFAQWRMTGRLGYLYGFFIAWGLALSVKVYALLVVPVLLLWMISDRIAGGNERPEEITHVKCRLAGHLFLGLALAALIVALLYAPAFWALDAKMEFIRFWYDRVYWIALGGRGGWKITPLLQVFLRTPVVMLIFALAGVITSIICLKGSSLCRLLLLWLFVPLCIPCLPHVLVYQNGMRLFLVFAVPFALLSVFGCKTLAEKSASFVPRGKILFVAIFSAMLFAANAWAAFSAHPFQTTFFNAIAGGLKGAQKTHIGDACDYWLNSYKMAGLWLDEKARENAKVIAVYYSGTHPQFNRELLRYSLGRKDLSIIHVPTIPTIGGKVYIPDNSYLVFVPFDYLRDQCHVLEETDDLEAVYRITSQQGEICTVYYKK